MSRSGVLFRTRDEALPLETSLQMRIALAAGGTDAGSYVACSGRVVRTVQSVGCDGLMAVAIGRFRIHRAPGAAQDASLVYG